MKKISRIAHYSFQTLSRLKTMTKAQINKNDNDCFQICFLRCMGHLNIDMAFCLVPVSFLNKISVKSSSKPFLKRDAKPEFIFSII